MSEHVVPTDILAAGILVRNRFFSRNYVLSFLLKIKDFSLCKLQAV